MIQFRFSASKAHEAIEWMLATADRKLDFHTILKAMYFADKAMLNAFGRPIFGATYRAMKYGPVSVEAYEMLKCEPYWLGELDREDYPWERTGFNVQLTSGRNSIPEPDHLAKAELEALRDALNKSLGMTFDERTRETHGMDWVLRSRRLNNRMAYEDMIDESASNRSELIEDLQAIGNRLVL